MSQSSSCLFDLSPTVSEQAKPSPTLALNERVTALWKAGETVYHLGFGESRFPVHPKVAAALQANVHQRSYLAGQGLAELREAVAGFYTRHWGGPVAAKQVIVGPGSKSLIFALQMALEAEPILPTPSWVSYAPQAHLLRKRVHRIPASPQDDYTLRLDALDAVVRQAGAGAKMLVINSPNNPTSQMYTPAFLAELADYCRREGIVVVSDEIYAFVPHMHTRPISMAQFYPEGTVVLGGLSQHLSLGGWRLGVAVVPDHAEGGRLMQALRVIAGEIWSTPSAPVQYAAVTAYSGDPDVEAYIAECAAVHAVRTQHLWQRLTGLGIRAPRPDGGFYVFANFDRWRAELAARGVHTSTELAEHLLEEMQIASLPGTAFATPPQDLSLRLASSYLDMESDAQAHKILDLHRNNPDPDAFMREHHPATQEAIRRFEAFVASLG